jgi:hypothetical protein
MTINTGTFATIIRLEITAGLTRDLTMPYVLQMASGENFSTSKEVSVKLTTLVFIANIIDELFLGLDVLDAHIASTDFGRCVLRMGDEVPAWYDYVYPSI